MDKEKLNEISSQIQVNRGRFEYYNKTRRDHLYSSIEKEEVLDLLEILPFLLISNYPELPGYVEYETPVTGMYKYQPSARAVTFLRSRFPSVSTIVKPENKPFIQMFALMGSGGTIAFNQDSDFDFWVCVDIGDYEQKSIDLFKKKCHAIETWAAEKFGKEVHFFLNDIARVRRNIFDDDSEETLAGSSLGELLKEEFFRSSIVMNGKIPFWWAVPADANDAVYNEWLIAAQGTGIADEFVDLGNLYTVVREDFLGAALFQILKSLGNPFKSIIKLGLVERYLNSSTGNPFISNLIKRNVHEGKLDIDSIDSYVIMFNNVYDFYNSIVNDSTATDLLKSCFYLKVDPKLSTVLDGKKNATASVPVRIQKMAEYARQWNWNEPQIRKIDDFENWDIDSVNKLWNNTKKFILRGYKNILTRIQDRKDAHRITGEELQSISRKIYSHFSMSDNKIDNSLTFKNYPAEKLLNVEFIRDRENNEYWTLSKRVISDNYPAKIIIHKEKNLLNLIVWIGLNKLFQKDYTRMEIDKGLYPVDPNFLRELVTELSVFFSFKRVELLNSYFLKNPFPMVSVLIINPFSKYEKKIDEIYFLHHNSWGETKYEKANGEAGIPQIMVAILNGALKTRLDFNSAIRMTSSHPYVSSKEFDRILLLLKDLYSFMIETRTEGRKRYITMFGNTYYVFTLKRSGSEDSVVCGAYDSEVKMLYSLSYNTGVHTEIRTDPTVPELSVLRTIIENYKENVIQIYYQIEHKYAFFYVSDERGSIVYSRKYADSLIRFLASLYLFTENLANKIIESNPGSALAESAKRIEVYQVERDMQYRCTLNEINPELDSRVMEVRKNLKPFTLSFHLLDNGEVGYRFTLPDGGYTELLSTKAVYDVTGEIKVLMESVEGYGFYATDVNLTHLTVKLYKDYTSLIFSEKNRFELLIERGIG